MSALHSSRRSCLTAIPNTRRARKRLAAARCLRLAPGKGILAHREPNGALHTYVALKKPEDWIASIDFSDPVAALARVAEEFDGWAPELTALITDGETDPVLALSMRCRSSTDGTAYLA